jgi:thiol-disulfide isomerase/thioredoxin
MNNATDKSVERPFRDTRVPPVPHWWVDSHATMRPNSVFRTHILRGIAKLAALGMLAACTSLAIAEPELRRWDGVDPPPPIELKTLDGKPFALSQLRGKVVLVNFWATWCEPCVEEMPSIQKLRARLAGQPFEVVAVNHQEGEAKIRAFLQKVPLEFTIVRDTDGAVTRAWKARIFPSSFVVDADGKIRYALTGAADWDAVQNVRQIRALLPATVPANNKKPE